MLTLYLIQARTALQHALRDSCLNEHRIYEISFFIYRVSLKSSLITNIYFVAPQLEEFQLWVIFQKDGATPHWVSRVLRFLDATFPNRWIGRDSPTPCPPRSPGITPLDFFLWGYVKDKVFSTPVPDITNLKARKTDAFATVTEDMLENTWTEIDYRLDVLRVTKGAHIEVC